MHPVALDRFCQRVLKKIETIGADTSKSSHQRYLDIWMLMRRRDGEVAQAFNDMRLSRAVARICAIESLGLLTDEEFSRFSGETRRTVHSLLGLDPL